VELAWIVLGGALAASGPLGPQDPPPEAAVEVESRFAWPKAPRPLPPFPSMKHAMIEPVLTPEDVLEWYRRGEADPVGDVLDAILSVPEYVFDSVVEEAAALLPRPRVRRLLPKSEEGILARVLEFHVDPRSGRLYSDFLHQWAGREYRYLSRFGESRASTVGFEEGTEDVDTEEFSRDQRKILLDALRRTYFSKYRFRPAERLRDEAFYFNEWKGMDFVVLPPAMAAYLWLRGLEKRFSIQGTSLRVSLEPLSRWREKDEDLVAGVGLEWAPTRDFPVAFLLSAGRSEGSTGIDFVGIGTSLGTAIKALRLQE